MLWLVLLVVHTATRAVRCFLVSALRLADRPVGEVRPDYQKSGAGRPTFRVFAVEKRYSAAWAL